MSVRLNAIAVALLTFGLAGCDGFSPPEPPTGPSGTPGFLSVVVSGTVLDIDGVPCAGARVAMQFWANTTSDTNGRYTLPAVQTRPGTPLPISASGDDCLTGGALSAPATTGTLNVDLKLTRVYPLTIDESTTAILRTTDAGYSVSSWYDDSTAWQVRHYRISTPADGDISVELDWERVGNAALQIWSGSGQISETVDGKQVLKLPRNQKAWFMVAQPQAAGPLSMPVRFTLEARRAG